MRRRSRCSSPKRCVLGVQRCVLQHNMYCMPLSPLLPATYAAAQVMISGSGIVPLLHSPRGRDLSSLGSPRSITSESELEAFLSPRVAAAEPTGELGSSAAALQAGGGSSGGVFAPSSYSCPAGVVDEVQLVKAMLSPGGRSLVLLVSDTACSK